MMMMMMSADGWLREAGDRGEIMNVDRGAGWGRRDR